ncbi:MAG: DUF1559 domain-containing protein [Planctomycetota bacterium]
MIPASSIVARHPAGRLEKPRHTRSPAAFSLVEVLVVTVILAGVLGLMLPAIQRAREAARRTTCRNNVRQAALAVTGYEAAKRRFPAGCDQVPAPPLLEAGTLLAWSAVVLPFLEESGVASRIDLSRAWNDHRGNAAAAVARVPAYICPSALQSYAGKADYGGVAGAWMLGVAGVPFPGPTGLTNGMLVPRTEPHSAVTAATATDGLGHTLLVAESTDRGPPAAAPADADDPAGRWATMNCFAQASAFVNADTGDIRGPHAGGAEASFADGRVAFLSDQMDPAVLAAICTRNGGESAAGLPVVP